MVVYYLTRDLLFSSRITSAARASGIEVTLFSRGDLLEAQLGVAAPLAILVDLEHPDATVTERLAAWRSQVPGAKWIAYGPHVKEDLLLGAQAAGCDVVMSRGQFDKQILPYLLALTASA